MLNLYERKIIAIFLALLVFIFCVGCSPVIPELTVEQDENELSNEEPFVGLKVSYIDVGQGDCILISFPDGKNLMIDCGNGSPFSVEAVKGFLAKEEINVLDYLVLTHPDVDHVGSVTVALQEVIVKKVYHPDVPLNIQGFKDYYSALDFLKEKGAEDEISLQGVCFGKDYTLAILAPTAKNMLDSSYRDFLWAKEPTDALINDLSPYIYLEYKGFTFLFTGDCGSKQEEKLVKANDSNVFNRTFADKGVKIKLENIDFLKVAHHGSEFSTTKDFLALLKPKHAVISVGGDNVYGHPSTNVQKRLVEANEKVAVLRTDVLGTITVTINNKGQMSTNIKE